MFDFLKKLFLPITATLDFITKYFKTIVFLTILYFIFFNAPNEEGIKTELANLQKIELSGPIIDVSKVLENIEKAKKDEHIKGILFVIDSPGGAVAPSVEVAYAIKELSSVKPVVTYASGVIASGSYYASIWSNKIIANPGSIVGSIGVIMQGFEAGQLLEKIGINAQTVKAGKYKESGTPTRKWTDFEEKQLQSVINDTYNMFISDVSSARKLDVKNHTIYADAKIFTSKQAKEVGLVDEVATLNFAKDSLVELSKVQKPVWKKEDKFEKFMDKFMSEAISKISIAFSNQLKAVL